ncbi:hypothetical protein [Alkalihalobacillus sp. 1P02AB]
MKNKKLIAAFVIGAVLIGAGVLADPSALAVDSLVINILPHAH